MNFMKIITLCIVILSCDSSKKTNTSISNSINPNSEFRIIGFTPNEFNGEAVKELSILFNEPVVSIDELAKENLEMPIDIWPSIACNWKWLNDKTLQCYLEEELPKARTYDVTISDQIKNLNGDKLDKKYKFSFQTEGWKVFDHETNFSQPDLLSVIFNFSQEMNTSTFSLIESTCGELDYEYIGKNKENEFQYKFKYRENIGLAKYCKITLPESLNSIHGKSTGLKYEMSFTTYPEFSVEVKCEEIDSVKSKDFLQVLDKCDPEISMTMSFSTPVKSTELLANIKDEPSFAFNYSYPTKDMLESYPENEHREIHLGRPNKANFEALVDVSELKDIFGRNLVSTKKVKYKTIDFFPTFKFENEVTVLENDGKSKFFFSSRNVSELLVEYKLIKSLNKVDFWEAVDTSYRDCPAIDESFYNKKKLVKANTSSNKAMEFPIEFDEIINGEKGIIIGRISSLKPKKDVNYIKRNYSSIEDDCETFMIQYTDIGITSKIGYFSTDIWVNGIKSSKPKNNIKVKILSESKVIAEGTTNSDGYVSLDGPSIWDPKREIEKEYDDLFIVAETEKEISILPMYHHKTFSSWRFGINSMGPLSVKNNKIIHTITDRPIYRPNEKANIKVFARKWSPRSFALSPAEKITIAIRDSYSEEVFKKDVKLNSFGTASFDLEIGSDFRTGRYSINMIKPEAKHVWDKYMWIGGFQVQEFTPPSIKVTLDPVEKNKNDFKFKSKVEYYFGGGVSKVNGKYKLTYQSSRWRAKKKSFKDFSFSAPFKKDQEESYFRSSSIQILDNGEIKSDDEGFAEYVIDLAKKELKSYGVLNYEVSFPDDRGKDVASRISSFYQYGDFNIGINLKKWTYQKDEKINPQVVILDYNENLIDDQKVTLELWSRKYNTVRTKTQGSYYGYESQIKDKLLTTCDFKSTKDYNSCDLSSETSGLHFIVAKSKDKSGIKVESSYGFYITGSDYGSWYQGNKDLVEVIPDQDKYKVGDTLKLLIKNPFKDSTRAVLTYERFGVLKYLGVNLTGGVEIVDVPIDSPDYAPGFFLGVQLFRGRVSEKIENKLDLGKPSFKIGMVKVNVEYPDSVLEIGSSLDKLEYEPKDEVTLNLESLQGASELAVAVVDEKILAVAGNYKKHFNLHEKFYSIDGSEVKTANLLSYLVGRRHFGQKGANPGGDGAGSANSGARADILPLAYWNPSVVTDDSGRAQVKFKIPDNLTTWKVLIIGVDKKHRFGFSENSFISKKKVMIEPALPNFLTEGDEFNPRVSVFNRSGLDSNINTTLRTNLSHEEMKDSKIKDNDKSTIDWNPIKVNKAGDLEIVFESKLKDGPFKDIIKTVIPIIAYESYEVVAINGSNSLEETSINFKKVEDSKDEKSKVELFLSSTILNQIEDSVKYGVNYPYICWEQTMNRALAYFYFHQFNDYFTDEFKSTITDPLKKTEKLLERIVDFQSANGGVGFWKKDDRSVNPYLSVFTAYFFKVLKSKNVEIPENAYKNLLNYIHKLGIGENDSLNSLELKDRVDIESMIAYVDEKLPNKDSFITALLEKGDISKFALSFLWSASKNSDLRNKIKKKIFSDLDVTSNSIQLKDDHSSYRTLSASEKTQCSVLRAGLENDESKVIVSGLVNGVVKKLNSKGHWGNTHNNMYCMMALEDYSKSYEKEFPEFVASSNLEPEKKIKVKGYQASADEYFKSKASDIKSDTITIYKKGKGRVYYKLRYTYLPNQIDFNEKSRGIGLSREYFVKEKDKWSKLKSKATINRGDIVKIKLSVKSPGPRYHVALRDYLPAGLSPLNTALATTALSGIEIDDEGSWWSRYYNGGFYHSDIRLRGAMYFSDYLTNKNYEKVYYAQAIASGKFNAMPALVEEMYAPEVYGKSSSFIIHINN